MKYKLFVLLFLFVSPAYGAHFSLYKVKAVVQVWQHKPLVNQLEHMAMGAGDAGRASHMTTGGGAGNSGYGLAGEGASKGTVPGHGGSGSPGLVGGEGAFGSSGGTRHQTIVNVYGGGLANTTDIQNLVSSLNQNGQSGTVRLNVTGSSYSIPSPAY